MIKQPEKPLQQRLRDAVKQLRHSDSVRDSMAGFLSDALGPLKPREDSKRQTIDRLNSELIEIADMPHTLEQLKAMTRVQLNFVLHTEVLSQGISKRSHKWRTAQLAPMFAGSWIALKDVLTVISDHGLGIGIFYGQETAVVINRKRIVFTNVEDIPNAVAFAAILAMQEVNALKLRPGNRNVVLVE